LSWPDRFRGASFWWRRDSSKLGAHKNQPNWLCAQVRLVNIDTSRPQASDSGRDHFCFLRLRRSRRFFEPIFLLRLDFGIHYLSIG